MIIEFQEFMEDCGVDPDKAADAHDRSYRGEKLNELEQAFYKVWQFMVGED